MAKYLLGVDGGNSKTDYMLCREDGTFIDIMRRPSCSHEHMPTGYAGAQDVMQSHLNDLFAKNNIKVTDIASAAFGLAGADMPLQVDALSSCIRHLGFTKFTVANDGILGVKAVAESGVCAINGAGTVVVGIDLNGNVLQVGGIGPLSGDHAGGYHIARNGIAAVYSHLTRMGEYTAIIPEIMNIYSINNAADLHNLIGSNIRLSETATEIVRIIDNAALKGDRVASKILDKVGICCAEGVCGCIRNLSFEREVLVVKAGSIWHKLQYPGLVKNFTDTVRQNTALATKFVMLDSPPVLGAIFWAKEQLHGPIDTKYRNEMLNFFKAEKYDELVRGGH